MRTLAAFVLLWTMSVPAHAQRAAPTPVSIDASRLSTRMRRESERCVTLGCESVLASAHVVLEIDEGGAARISLRGERRSMRVPASAGAGGIEQRASREHATWSGHAHRLEQTLVITLDRAELAEVHVNGPLAGALPSSVSAPFVGEVRCRIEPVAVLPATPALDERPVPIGLMRCRWAEAPPIFAAYGGSRWALGVGLGVYEITTENPSTRHVVRLPP